MRLWHSKLIPLLDGKRLCDLHMSCCNLRGKGWGKPNKSINYIYDDPLGEDALASYHELVLKEMYARGYKFDMLWLDPTYCGKNRPSRQRYPDKFEKIYERDVPLLGHTLEIFRNDVLALRERGLDIEASGVEDVWSGRAVIKASREGKEIIYKINTKEV